MPQRLATLPRFDDSRQLVDVGQNELAVLDLGAGDAVLFVHGVFVSSQLWAPALALLPPGRRYIAVDLPAHGHSPAANDAVMSIPGCADLLGPLLDRLGVDRVHLVGSDSGGAIVQRFAVAHGDRVASLTLTNCDTEGNIPPAAFAPVVELARSGGLAGVVAQMCTDMGFARSPQGLGSSLQNPAELADDDIVAFLGPLVSSSQTVTQLERFVASFQPSDLEGVTEAQAGLQLPTLVAWGTRDVFFGPKWGRALAAALGASARLVEIDGGRLFWPMERADELAALLVPHWNSVTRH
jgi:pimeloyl-ACP methyl ester carboxylesterase